MEEEHYTDFVKVFTREAVLHVIYSRGIAVYNFLIKSCNCNRLAYVCNNNFIMLSKVCNYFEVCEKHC
jgi:hypothetical protein